MIFISVIIAVFMNFLIGWQLLRLLQIQVNFVMRLTISYLIGQLFSSLFYFSWLLLNPGWELGWLFIEIVFVATLFVINTKLMNTFKRASSTELPFVILSRKQKFLSYSLSSFVGLIIIYLMWVMSWFAQTAPYGMWDAAAMWNLRISFLVDPIEQWRYIFSMHTAHPDYPLLHSISVARLCAIHGKWVPAVSQWYGFSNAVIIVIMIYSVILKSAGVWQAFLAALLLFSTEYWWGLTTWQYADHTLSSYFTLSAIVCYWWGQKIQRQSISHSYPLLILLALATGACVWTKNEGWPWAMIMSLLIFGVSIKHSRKQLPRFAMIWLGSLFLVLWMPITVQMLAEESNDLVTSVSLTQTTSWLLDFSRTSLIFSTLIDVFSELYPSKILALALIWILWYRPWHSLKQLRPVLAIFFLIGLQTLCYLLIYQITPNDLKWHLGTSANRLMLQLWPVVLLGLFLMATKNDALPVEASMNNKKTSPSD